MADSDDDKVPSAAVHVVEQVDPLIRDLAPEQRAQLRHIIVANSTHTGPLPPPHMLEEYGRVIPNGAERLMGLLETQTAHRIKMEELLVAANIKGAARGQHYAFLLSIFFGAAALALGLTGHEWLGGAMGVSTVVSLATIFVLRKEPKPAESSEEEPPRQTPPAKRPSVKKRRS